MKTEITNKKIDLKNIFILITSTIFYASEPYFVKLASSKGANEYGINVVYYLIAITVFYYLYRKKKKEIPEDELKDLEEKIQKMTDKYVSEIDSKCEAKCKDILSV